jgi:ribosomal protein S18 acetylase RimI-like enzyme
VNREGPTSHAFNFQRLFPSPEPAFTAAPVIAPLAPHDRESWEVLARGYKLFYNTPTTDEEYARAWTRLMQRDGIIGLGATVDGRLVGIAHYLFHTNVWAPTACYLQDLYTDPALRGRGIARALIEAVADDARAQGAARYYWLTQSSNATARTLYDKVAAFKGFIRYDYPLGSGVGYRERRTRVNASTSAS